MKSRLKVASILLLFALVLSLVPAAALPSNASAAPACDWAQFIADVTVPDGTSFSPGATFKKTWRLKNIGTCTWTTSYSLVFDSGEKMGASASMNFPSSVAPGQTIDLSVDMTAPTNPGHYIGYWKFKNASGVLFGIGFNSSKSWWVEINVTGTPTANVAYDFTANAGSATWSSGAGGLSFPGTDGDAKGFALKLDHPNFESGVNASQPGLLFAPQQITNGFIQARYPNFTVQSGDRFQTTVGCQAGATSCYVAYRLDYEVGGTIRTFWTWRERFEGWTYDANLDLSPLAGQDVKFILYISAWGSPLGDRALWGNPVIVRKGGTTPTLTPTVTGTPPTPTPVPATIPPSACDKAQFIADVNIPDGTILNAGATFTKTWRLKNVGSCAWSTSYQLVFFSGDQMGAPSSAAFPQNVPVGQTIDISVNMTAPALPGHARGYWMFKNANGALFGIGVGANKPWWVDINVLAGPTTTPTATAFQNTKYKFKFTLPTGATIASQSDNTGRVDLPFSAGTNLHEKYVQVNVVEGANPCVSPAVGGTTNAPENVTINNIQFVKLTGSEGAAGNFYDWVTYSTTHNNACISLAFILHSVNPGNFPTPPPVFDKTAESAVFATIMSTFNWIP